MDAFDADVLIYAAVAGHELGRRVRALFPTEPVEGTEQLAGIGSVLLLPELLTKPLREGATEELDELGALLGRLDLRPTDEATAEMATALGASYGLRAADAVHLPRSPPAPVDSSRTTPRTSRGPSARSTSPTRWTSSIRGDDPTATRRCGTVGLGWVSRRGR